jgi:hypothetical protein
MDGAYPELEWGGDDDLTIVEDEEVTAVYPAWFLPEAEVADGDTGALRQAGPDDR